MQTTEKTKHALPRLLDISCPFESWLSTPLSTFSLFFLISSFSFPWKFKFDSAFLIRFTPSSAPELDFDEGEISLATFWPLRDPFLLVLEYLDCEFVELNFGGVMQHMAGNERGKKPFVKKLSLKRAPSVGLSSGLSLNNFWIRLAADLETLDGMAYSLFLIRR